MFFSHNYSRIKTDLSDSLRLEKSLTLHNVIIILIKSVVNKNQNYYYYIVVNVCFN